MSLDKYWAKRDFGKTPEPRGKAVKAGKQLAYFIQKHDARNLHYDFRLELDGTLKSWAIPKGPSLDPADKRLAVHVEDHPLEYGLFEGEIPAREYGAGKVQVWDKGVWEADGDPADGYRRGHLKLTLNGVKLSGRWALVRMGAPKQEKENWLLIKEKDSAARTGKDADITRLQPDSVLAKPAKKNAPKRTPEVESPEAAGALETAMPEMIRPQLATLADRAPHGDAWLSEIKFDGYRAVCRIENKTAALFTRTGNDWSKKWKTIADAAAQLPVTQAWLDGEVVAIDEHGAISFQLLQNIARNAAPGRLAYYVFDLLYLNGYDLRPLPLAERKALLEALLEKADPEGPLLYSQHVDGNPADVFSHACMHALEGIIAKRADAPYESARNNNWLKVKCQLRQEFVIGGYTDPAGSREKFGALLLGVHDDAGQLHYAGRVGTGFADATLKALHKDFRKLAATASPFVKAPPRSGAPALHWLKPALIAEVKFAQWTDGGLVRHASFVGLRKDKPAREIRREKPVPVEEAAAPAQPRRPTGAAADAKGPTVAGVRLTHPSRALFPETGITKLKLARYYEDIAEWVLPHLAQRPLTLVRCPNGGGQQCFFQKHANDTIGPGIEKIEVPGGDAATYMMVNSIPSLIGMVQMSVLELHTWGARNGHLDQPDRIIFDLDPAPGLDWMRVVEAAQLIRGLLDEIGLASFVKTTGGKGLHVVVPIKPEKSWAEIKAFSRAIAEHLEKMLPDRFTASMSKAKRGGRIFVDYLRNALEATAVAAYSTRARLGAPVSTPLAWEELGEEIRSDTFTVLNLRARLDSLKQDPWADYFLLKQRVTAKMQRTFGAN
ncbi:MAG: DNA ligase D [Pseudomonadota bacterium]